MCSAQQWAVKRKAGVSNFEFLGRLDTRVCMYVEIAAVCRPLVLLREAQLEAAGERRAGWTSKGCHSIAWRRTTHSTQYESES